MRKFFSLLPVMLYVVASAFAQQKPLYDTLQKPQLISKQFSFTEGPATDKKGNIFFTDQPNNRIWKYDTDGRLSIFMEPAGRANGMYFDKKDQLVACADEQGQLWRINLKNKNVTILLKAVNGLQPNGPNDCWVNRLNDGIYFTDPYYQRDYWERKTSALDGEKVYFMSKRGQLIVVDDKLKKPNGITGSADGKQLYVADIGANKTYRYNILPDGSLSGKTLFCNQGSDGMTVDAAGNVYLTGRGVIIYNKEGQKIGHIKIDEPWTANVCFGGKDKQLLFITASTAIYTLQMNVKGVE